MCNQYTDSSVKVPVAKLFTLKVSALRCNALAQAWLEMIKGSLELSYRNGLDRCIHTLLQFLNITEMASLKCLLDTGEEPVIWRVQVW